MYTRCLYLAYLLLASTLVFGQVATILSLPSLNSFALEPLSAPMLFSIPSSSSQVALSLALCSTLQPPPVVFMTNATSSGAVVGPTDPSSWQLAINDGVGVWIGEMRNGGMIGVWVGNGGTSASGSWSYEIAVQEGEDSPHGFNPSAPLLGDTTSSIAIVLSPPFHASRRLEPIYPNYTLPHVTPDERPPTSSEPDTALIVLKTPETVSSIPLYRSACALRQQLQTPQGIGRVAANASLVLRDPEVGWRTEFIIQDLSPSTNYTVFITQGPKISGPLYFLTKSPNFPCTMVHALPYCPMVTYPVPLQPPPFGSVYDRSNLPQAISSSILKSLENLSKTLSTFPCGRDLYSPLRTCQNCFDAYRAWLCTVSLPRCTEGATTIGSDVQRPLVSRPGSSPPRAAGFFPLTADYEELQPCIEGCNLVGRDCPPFLRWQCPSPSLNAGNSYALGYIDSRDGTLQGKGVTGTATDIWGNIWCNGLSG
ncbi:stretch-activated cation channel mid1 [Tulasnella sp. 418]|nr:stretch-activated cation channel mid1 [Tulasnella sp. 418]